MTSGMLHYRKPQYDSNCLEQHKPWCIHCIMKESKALQNAVCISGHEHPPVFSEQRATEFLRQEVAILLEGDHMELSVTQAAHVLISDMYRQ